jgi:hypothetical protein
MDDVKKPGRPKRSRFTSAQKVAMIVAALTALSGIVVAFVNGWFSIQRPTPSTPTNTVTLTTGWQYFNSPTEKDAASRLTLAGPDPKDVSAFCTTAGDIHVWYRGGGTGAVYDPDHVIWSLKNPTQINFFHNDGTVVPIGWNTRDGLTFTYLRVTRPPHN